MKRKKLSVWVVEYGYDYEGYEARGVFFDIETAREYAKSLSEKFGHCNTKVSRFVVDNPDAKTEDAEYK